MPTEAREWTRVSRVRRGGAHFYIPKGALEEALQHAEMDPAERNLKVRATWLRSHRHGMARLILEIERETEMEASERERLH